MYTINNMTQAREMQTLLNAYVALAAKDAAAVKVLDDALAMSGYTDRYENADIELRTSELVIQPEGQLRKPYIMVYFEYYNDHEGKRDKGRVYLSVNSNGVLAGDY